MMSSFTQSLKTVREGPWPSLTVFATFVFFLCSGMMGLMAAPNTRGQYYPDDKAIAIQQMRDSIEDVRHQVHNHEAEIRTYDEKLANFETIIESIRDELGDSGRAYKEQLKGSSGALESKITSLESISKGLVADLRQFKIHSNETTTVLMQYEQKLNALEKSIDRQNQNIEHLQAAMSSLMEALQGTPKSSKKNTGDSSYVPSNGDRSYTVKGGDSLEKIARAHQISIQALKTANGLTTDRIIVGKKLVIPEK